MSEAELQKQVAIYLRMQYPEAMFHSDFGSGAKLTPWQAKVQKVQNGGRRAWPDLFIAEPSVIAGEGLRPTKKYHGLFIELKKEGVRLRKKKDGSWATPHIEEQAEILAELRNRGYMAEFAVGFEQALDLIDDYLGGIYGRH